MFVTIRAKLIGLSLLSLLSLVIVGGISYYGKSEMGRINDHAQGKFSLLDTSQRINVAPDEIRAEMLQILREIRNGETVVYSEAIKSLNDRLKAYARDVAGIKDSPAISDDTREAANVLRTDADEYAKSVQTTIQLVQADQSGSDAQLDDFNEKYRKLKKDLAQLNNQLTGEMVSAHQAVREAVLGNSTMVLAAAAAMLVLVALFSLIIFRGVMGPVDKLREGIAKVEAGHYEVKVNLNTRDEIGALGRAFDRLIDEHLNALKSTAGENERLNNSVIGLFSAMGALSEKDLTVRAPVTEDIIGTLGDAINQLTMVIATVLLHVTKVAGVVEDASEQMKKQSDVVNDMAKEEDVIVQRLISNLETAMASIGEVAIYARDSNRAAAEATKSTESAMTTVQATLVGMNAIRETISEMEKRIKRLAERSQEISQIVNLINTISERTHVLSLNAAMQAAMAGEAGRGFAVVAEEVQRLAENSRQATGQIANLVQNIQIETNDTIATVNKTIEQVVNESDLAHNAGERMRETHESTARLVRLVATIAASSAEQTKIASVLRAAADEIAQFTEKTAEQLKAQNQSAASLVSASQKLVSAISVFKLPGAESSPAEESESDRTQIFVR